MTKPEESFLFNCLQKPSYGYERAGQAYYPTASETLKEYLSRLNIFKTRKNWFPFSSFIMRGYLFLVAFYCLLWHFSWVSVVLSLFFYMYGAHMWELIHHRGFTHEAFRVKNMFWTQVLKIISPPMYPVETFDFSHRSHHQFSDQIGDPHSPKGGLFYIWFAEMNHQLLRHDLTAKEYETVCNKLKKYCLFLNSYKSYQKWGTAVHPAWYISYVLILINARVILANIFFGPPIAIGYIFAIMLSQIDGHLSKYYFHGYGKDLRRPGNEYAHDLSYNHWLSILFTSQWHSNHHLYSQSANTGLKKNQLDLSYQFIRLLQAMGIVTHVKDYSEQFYREYMVSSNKA